MKNKSQFGRPKIRVYSLLGNARNRLLIVLCALLSAIIPHAHAMDEKEKEATAVLELLIEQQENDIEKKKDALKKEAWRDADNKVAAEDQAKRMSGEISIGFILGGGVVFPIVLAIFFGFTIGWLGTIFSPNEDRWFYIGIFIGGLMVPLMGVTAVITGGYPQDIALMITSLITFVIPSWYFRKSIRDVFSIVEKISENRPVKQRDCSDNGNHDIRPTPTGIVATNKLPVVVPIDLEQVINIANGKKYEFAELILGRARKQGGYIALLSICEAYDRGRYRIFPITPNNDFWPDLNSEPHKFSVTKAQRLDLAIEVASLLVHRYKTEEVNIDKAKEFKREWMILLDKCFFNSGTKFSTKGKWCIYSSNGMAPDLFDSKLLESSPIVKYTINAWLDAARGQMGSDTITP